MVAGAVTGAVVGSAMNSHDEEEDVLPPPPEPMYQAPAAAAGPATSSALPATATAASNNTGKIIGFVFLAVVLLGVVGYCVYLWYDYKHNILVVGPSGPTTTAGTPK